MNPTNKTKPKEAPAARLLRAAVIGCGAIAENCHIPGYLNHPQVREIILCDPAEKRLRSAQQKFQIEKGYTDFAQLLRSEKPDLLSICTPNYLHADMACLAARHGVHILCEKPMALSLAEAERIRRAVTQKRVKFMVGFSHRFGAINIKAREMLSAGKIGRPFSLRVRFGHEGPYPGWGKTDWFYKREQAGQGALMDMGIHAIDLGRYFIGDIRGVVARRATLFKPTELEDNAVMLLEFETGALGCIEVSWTSKPGFNGSEIYGSGGTLLVDYERGLQFFDGEKAQWSTIPVQEDGGSWKREMEYFINCVLRDDDPEPVSWMVWHH